ncbi:hypothetical protein [Intrasporangium sp. DVR]|uniref:hypothetical protein n=1 Tax=Intrasporangium sp. DVR TaxID=3127867 RepID=UPI00313A5BEF
MKNYPNQASTFGRIRDTLAIIHELNDQGEDATADEALGYAAAQAGVYTFRGLDGTHATQADVDARIDEEKEKPKSSQGVLTFARELRRTLRDMGWIEDSAQVTDEGKALLATGINSVEEQALLVEGLLSIQAYDRGQIHYHHPVRTMLRLLALAPSLHREGLELALAPVDDSDAEFDRVAKLYGLSRSDRMKALGITQHQRANAVKIFPSLAVTAGLIVEDDHGYFSLSQDGWNIIGGASTAATLPPAAAKKAIAQRRGRRTTVGKLVTTDSVAARRATKPPKTLSPEEQARAAEKLQERTALHQALVKRLALHIGDGVGELFEDEFSYDLLWVPDDDSAPLVLWEMKSVSNETDAYARARHAVGQLSYYQYFHVEPTWTGRTIARAAAFDADIPGALADYLNHDGIGAIVHEDKDQPRAVNSIGQTILDQLPET